MKYPTIDMGPNVKRLYKEAIKNKDFEFDLTYCEDGKNLKPKSWSSDKHKLIYATVYYGWLIGKGELEYAKTLKKDAPHI